MAGLSSSQIQREFSLGVGSMSVLGKSVLPKLCYSVLQALWEANKEPLIAFLEEAGKAQRGIVVDQVRAF